MKTKVIVLAEKKRSAEAKALLHKLRKAGKNDMEIALACEVSWRTVYRWREGAVPRVRHLEALRKIQ